MIRGKNEYFQLAANALSYVTGFMLQNWKNMVAIKQLHAFIIHL